jgi:hypothetical protein
MSLLTLLTSPARVCLATPLSRAPAPVLLNGQSGPMLTILRGRTTVTTTDSKRIPFSRNCQGIRADYRERGCCLVSSRSLRRSAETPQSRQSGFSGYAKTTTITARLHENRRHQPARPGAHNVGATHRRPGRDDREGPRVGEYLNEHLKARGAARNPVFSRGLCVAAAAKRTHRQTAKTLRAMGISPGQTFSASDLASRLAPSEPGAAFFPSRRRRDRGERSPKTCNRLQ